MARHERTNSLISIVPSPKILYKHFRDSLRARVMAILTITTTVFAIVFTVGLLLHGNTKAKQGDYIERTAQKQDGLMFLGHVYNVDVSQRQVGVSWLIIGCGKYKWEGTTTYGSTQCGRLNIASDFYVDGASEADSSYDPSANPVFPGTNDPIYVQPMYEFQTTHLLQLYSWHGLDQQFAYPFDTYQLDTTMVALSTDTNTSLPILSLHLIDSTDNFSPHATFDIETSLSLSSFSSVNDTPSTPTGTGRAASVSFERTRFTKAFVITLFCINWALTAFVVLLTVSAFTGIEVGESILVLPLSVVLTIPALRAMWVGAPAFGLLMDSCGLFMQMVIVSLCSIALVISILKPRKKAAKDLRAAASAAVTVNAMTSRVGTMTQRERDHDEEAERQPLYHLDSGYGEQVDEMDGDMKRSEKVSDTRGGGQMV